jgi:cytochrome c5
MAWYARCLAAALALAAGAVFAATPSGQAVFNDQCASCHAAGTAGAPKLGDTAEWTRRLKPGLNALYRGALLGVPGTAMAAKGGFRELSDADVKGAVDYLLEQAKVPPAVLRAAAARRATNADFLRLDGNGDDYLSRAEAAQDRAVGDAFARFDRDRDGRLSEAEFLALDAALATTRAAVPVDDATLAAAVAQALAKTRGVPAAGIKVEAAAGVVTLKGAVDTGEEAQLAASAARWVTGVRQVDNKLVSKHALGFD